MKERPIINMRNLNYHVIDHELVRTKIHGQFMVIRVKKSNNIGQQETTRDNGAK